MSEKTISTINPEQQQAPAPSGASATNSAESSSALDSCRPRNDQAPAKPQSKLDRIRRFQRDEAFTRVGNAVTYAILIHRKVDAQGYYRGEDYHPIPGALQAQLGSLLRSVAFTPCLSQSGEHFILARKVDPPGAPANSWNQSLAEALIEPPGQWMKIWSDSLVQRYQYELVQPQLEGSPEYPDFAQDLEAALSPNIITSLDHPVIQRILGGHGADNDITEIY
jgi:hypothetical protein